MRVDETLGRGERWDERKRRERGEKGTERKKTKWCGRENDNKGTEGR